MLEGGTREKKKSQSPGEIRDRGIEERQEPPLRRGGGARGSEGGKLSSLGGRGKGHILGDRGMGESKEKKKILL